MPRKKTKSPPPAERHQTTLRLSEEEMAPLERDRKAIGGVPVSFGAYVKHAVTSYPKLRKLETMLIEAAEDAREHGTGADSSSIFALMALRGAGL